MNKFLFAAVFAGLLSLPATDPFDYSTSCNLGDSNCPNWTVDSGGSDAWVSAAFTGTAVPNGGADNDVVHWNADAFTADQYSQITVSVGASAGYIGPGVRLSTGATGYVFGCGSHTLYKFVGGSRSDLSTSYSSCSDGDVVKLQVTGTSSTLLKVYFNTVQNGSDYTDSSSPITSGAAGMWGYPSTPEHVDSWTGDNVGGPPPSTFPPGIINFPIRCCRFQVFGR